MMDVIIHPCWDLSQYMLVKLKEALDVLKNKMQ